MYRFSFPNTHSAGCSDHLAVVLISTASFKDTKFPSSKHSRHQNIDQYRGPYDSGELDLNSELNRTASDKLRQSTTVSSQCD